MNKYIYDEIRNNSRFILNDLSIPQKKAVSEMIRGIFTGGEPILRSMVQSENLLVRKQAEKYSHHLGNVNIKESVDKYSFKIVSESIKANTIIAYDLTDIAKESALKMEYISKVFDGSKRKISNGFLIHGVGVNNTLLKFEVHNNDKYTTNQIRKRIVENISDKLIGNDGKKKGIWVFDRGNDHKHFFKFLRHDLKVNFIARLKENRGVVLKETGAIEQVKNLSPGKYEVYLMNTNNSDVDLSSIYSLVISQHLDDDKQPIRLLSSLNINKFSEKQIVTMYLERWGVENIFKRVKTKFNLEKIRLLKHQKFVNLISLIQFIANVSTRLFERISKLTTTLISGVILSYKNFIKLKSLSFNLDSFVTYLKKTLKPFPSKSLSKSVHPLQMTLFQFTQLKKLVSF